MRRLSVLICSLMLLFVLLLPGASKSKAASQSFQVVAVQHKWNPEVDYASPDAFKAKIDSIMQDVMGKVDPNIPTLVTFPEHIGLPMLFIDNDIDILRSATTFAEAIQNLIKRHFAAVSAFRLYYGVDWVRALFLERSGVMAKAYLNTFKEMAAKYGVYLVAGSIPMRAVNEDGTLVKDDNTVYNLSYFFGPDGHLIGYQKKVNLVPTEQYKDENGNYGLDLNAGTLEELKVFSTPFGNVAIAICYDAFHYKVIWELVKKGGEILVMPSANPKLWTKEQQSDWLNSAWLATRHPYGLKWFANPMMVGPLKDITFEGQSSLGVNWVIAPEGPKMNYMDLDPITGFLSIAPSKDQYEIVETRISR
ncbi:Carbon-nitrogen hydrolase [Thermanaeromonas toyohensis ToBE]|uniref:Carbon-nitrogen hydrolase n=1 Tax=Thermanaeromonas toyohensis ToBE TaxID=698762 RepID=A0A1W1VVK4_9FIRM|nr:nitrilase-related carbon-nitrogen hydrolase [Thermanaeromonas toyohensis]SMB97378.1 Carbon-nitrogen hydrolase [Thermanaeromonas toyohensis ToBE]